MPRRPQTGRPLPHVGKCLVCQNYRHAYKSIYQGCINSIPCLVTSTQSSCAKTTQVRVKDIYRLKGIMSRSPGVRVRYFWLRSGHCKQWKHLSGLACFRGIKVVLLHCRNDRKHDNLSNKKQETSSAAIRHNHTPQPLSNKTRKCKIRR